MIGPTVLARYLSTPGTPDKFGNVWQYHSRSDRHSKVGCWGVAVDLLANSSVMQRQAEDGRIVLGVNHTMADFSTGRRKNLDLVIARPPTDFAPDKRSLRSLAEQYEIPLIQTERDLVRSLPDVAVAPVASALVALEAKACMTAHVKALPRLYDELNSSHLCVHGASANALAIAYVQVNAADSFISSDRNKHDLLEHEPEVTSHRQPSDTLRVLDKVAEMPRRSSNRDNGFDAVGVTVVDFKNDGTRVEIVTGPPAPQAGRQFYYDDMIVRMATEFDSRHRD